MRYVVPRSVLRAELHGEEILLNPETGIYHVVNATGREVIDALDEGRDVEDAVDRIANDTGEDGTRVRSDVDGFITAMVERGLLVEKPDGDEGSGS